MKRTELRTRRAPVVVTRFGTFARWDGLADSFEEGVSEDLVDCDDEREAVEIVVHGTIRSIN